MKKGIITLGILALVVGGCGQTTKKQETNKSNSICQSELPCTKETIEDFLIHTELKENKILTRSNIWDLLREKVKWFKEGLEPQANTDLLPLDFIEFHEKFDTDSLFQINNIQFDRLIGVIGECDTTIILNSKNWKIQRGIIKNFNEYPKKKNGDSGEIWNTYFFFNSTRILFVFEIVEVGVISQFGFEKIDGKWKQTLSGLNAC